MDKIDFINWLLEHFNVSDFIFEREIEKYSNGLLQNIDYSLMRNYVEEYIKSRPTSVELNKIATMHNFFIQDKKCPALKHIYEIKKIKTIPMENFDEELKDKIRKFCSKYGITPYFDKLQNCKG